MKIKALKIYKNKENAEEIEDEIIDEKTLSIYIDDHLITKLKASNGMFKEASIGFIVSEGILKFEDIEELSEFKDYISIKSKMPLKESDYKMLSFYRGTECLSYLEEPEFSKNYDNTFKVKKSVIFNGFIELQKNSKEWYKTGGVHSSGIIYQNKYFFAEDVSRHTTLDKIIGYGLLSGIDFSKSVVMTSGRLPGDAVIKLARVGIPIVASRSAILNTGYTVALKTYTTLIGFARGERMNIYTYPERIEI